MAMAMAPCSKFFASHALQSGSIRKIHASKVWLSPLPGYMASIALASFGVASISSTRLFLEQTINKFIIFAFQECPQCNKSEVFFGFAVQYCIMPVVGALVSRLFGLDPLVSAGLILMACCPGRTTSTIVTYIANGDVPLSVVVTACSTFGAVFATPLLTLLFAGTYVPVDVRQLAWSTLQVVLAPVLLGAWLQSAFPKAVEYLRIFSPLVAVLLSSLLASSVFFANASLLHPHLAATPSLGVQHVSLPSVALAVSLVHAAGFLLGYVAPKVRGLNEPQSRAVSIEVGMQNSSLVVVLAGTHFHSLLVLLAPAVSAIVLNVMGSFSALEWRNLDNKV